jgi:Ice-binding-like
MRSSHRSVAARVSLGAPEIKWLRVEFDPEADEMKRSRLAAAASVALRSKLPILSGAVVGLSVLGFGGVALATPTPVGLGTATDAAVLSGTQPTNTGVSTLTGDASSSPNASPQPGFGQCPPAPPASSNCVVYTAGSQHIVDGVANQQRADTTAAYIHTAGLPPDAALNPSLDLNTPVKSGIYTVGAANLPSNTTFTLDAANNAASVWIFQASSTITTGTGSSMAFINIPAGTTQAQLACNVFWTAVSSASLLGTNFVGTLMAQTSITVGDGVTVTGRLLAGTGDVTLIHDTINSGDCRVLPAGTGGGPAGTGGGTGGTGGGTGGTGGSTGGTGGTGGSTGGTSGTGGGTGGGTTSTGGGLGTGGGTAVSFAGTPATPVVATPQTTG